jgi:capsular exopolysaccharide synthesis family protein
MSRIHEALKKAERERAASPVQEQETAILEAVIQPNLAEPVLTKTEVRRTLWDVDPVEDATANAPGVGLLSPDYLRFDDLRKRCAHPQWNVDPNIDVFGNPVLSEHGAEQFRTLRSRLYQTRKNQTLRSLVVTSSVPGEGKTFVTVNLSQAIVRQPDRRAIIIDADLRCPRAHMLLGAPSTPGLTDYLRGEADETAIMQHGPEGNLCFIPGGSDVTNPSELLSNGRLGTLIERLAPVFDWVILDSPPCLPVADASILAGICDGVLLVVKAGSTPSAVAQRARQELQTRNIVGVVLNAVGEAHMYNSEYYHAYRYGYGNNASRDASK